ncbi:MAG TPA: iron-containing alcohol dehydrogenase [Victivallales bacterium]|nr:iron-containing alcohol dehydrogenase [Victivallales bacterium]
MKSFNYYNPVKIVFGKNTISELRNLIPADSKVLITYGGGSIKRNGVYKQVRQALEGYNVFEFSGIEANPLYETCMEAVALVKNNKIDFLLAVGGGSVLDGTKFISAASCFEGGDPWEILSKNAEIKSTLPLGSVMTLPATGSEMNCISVLSRQSTFEKLSLVNPKVYPKFSIIDPETTYSLPVKQVINGLVDSYIHVLEQYITYDVNSPLQDRQAEAILLTLHEIAHDIINKPDNFELRANFFWCATQALNGLIACGTVQDWSTHMIGIELTALYGLDHAKTVAVVLPRLLKYRKSLKKTKLLQYGNRIFGINEMNSDKAVNKTIDETELFFNSLGMKTKLSDYGINAEEAAVKIYHRFLERDTLLGENQDITPDGVRRILLDC